MKLPRGGIILTVQVIHENVSHYKSKHPWKGITLPIQVIQGNALHYQSKLGLITITDKLLD